MNHFHNPHRPNSQFPFLSARSGSRPAVRLLVGGWLCVVCSLVSVAASADETMRLEGFTEAYRDIQIGSSDTNRVSVVWAEEGERVRVGQTLVQLDDTVLRAAVAVARTAASARGEAEAAEQHLASRQRRLEQTESLLDRQHATDQELWNAQNERDEAAARVKAFVELQQRRELELRQAEMQLARLTVKSPIEGVVAAVLKDVGEVVSPADPHLVQLVQMDPLRVVASGPEKMLRQVQAGMELPVIIDQQRHMAVVEFVSPIVDAQSGMRSLKLRLPNPESKIASGVPVEVYLQGGEPVQIGEPLKIGETVQIGEPLKIGETVQIDETVRIGEAVQTGSDLQIGDALRIGDALHTGDALQVSEPQPATPIDREQAVQQTLRKFRFLNRQ